jgi:hypothetical protein
LSQRMKMFGSRRQRMRHFLRKPLLLQEKKVEIQLFRRSERQRCLHGTVQEEKRTRKRNQRWWWSCALSRRKELGDQSWMANFSIAATRQR